MTSAWSSRRPPKWTGACGWPSAASRPPRSVRPRPKPSWPDGPLSPARIGEAAEAAAGEIEPVGDIHATAAYRRQLTRVLVTRALTQAARAQAA